LYFSVTPMLNAMLSCSCFADRIVQAIPTKAKQDLAAVRMAAPVGVVLSSLVSFTHLVQPQYAVLAKEGIGGD
jgi:hypothetical protein